MNTTDKILHIEAPVRGVVAHANNNIGTMLVTAGKLSAADADRVMALQQREGWRFGEAARRLSLIDEDDLIDALYRQYDLPLRLPGHDSFSHELVTAYQPYHRATEELRALRTQLLIRWFKRPTVDQQVLAVVSPGKGEGRSYVAANLALLFSQLGERTLLIDADMRNPRQHRIFNVPDRFGLSTVLAGRAEPDAAVVMPGFHNLWLLPAGAPPPNPLELLSRPGLPALLKEYLGEFDIILIDTPPALRYTDAQAIGFRAGSAIVLARQNRTRLNDTNHVIRDLGECGTRVVGTVMNNF